MLDHAPLPPTARSPESNLLNEVNASPWTVMVATLSRSDAEFGSWLGNAANRQVIGDGRLTKDGLPLQITTGGIGFAEGNRVAPLDEGTLRRWMSEGLQPADLVKCVKTASEALVARYLKSKEPQEVLPEGVTRVDHYEVRDANDQIVIRHSLDAAKAYREMAWAIRDARSALARPENSALWRSAGDSENVPFIQHAAEDVVRYIALVRQAVGRFGGPGEAQKFNQRLAGEGYVGFIKVPDELAPLLNRLDRIDLASAKEYPEGRIPPFADGVRQFEYRGALVPVTNFTPLHEISRRGRAAS